MYAIVILGTMYYKQRIGVRVLMEASARLAGLLSRFPLASVVEPTHFNPKNGATFKRSLWLAVDLQGRGYGPDFQHLAL